jgi:hypothetical protein
LTIAFFGKFLILNAALQLDKAVVGMGYQKGFAILYPVNNNWHLYTPF